MTNYNLFECAKVTFKNADHEWRTSCTTLMSIALSILSKFNGLDNLSLPDVYRHCNIGSSTSYYPYHYDHYSDYTFSKVKEDRRWVNGQPIIYTE